VTPAVETLGGSRRSVVRRVPGPSSSTVIVKTFTHPDGWVREAAALSVLPPSVLAPRLLAAEPAPPTVIMSDLGTGPSVADALLGSSRLDAEKAVYAWADAVAALHRSTLGSRDAFLAALASPSTAVAPTSIDALLDTAFDAYATVCSPLGLTMPPNLGELLRAEAARLDNAAASALTPGDTCPDNNVFTDGGPALIDFENAEWRHIAWDAAYLRVPWPTCWCAWRMPSAVSDAAVERYRSSLSADLPYVGTADFDRDLAIATDLWCVLFASWLLPTARQ
jgi:hypothetical protein